MMSERVHIASIAIDSFRSLQSVELGDLKPINLFFGPNNSGKSTILEAVALFSRPLGLSSMARGCSVTRPRSNRRGPPHFPPLVFSDD